MCFKGVRDCRRSSPASPGTRKSKALHTSNESCVKTCSGKRLLRNYGGRFDFKKLMMLLFFVPRLVLRGNAQQKQTKQHNDQQICLGSNNVVVPRTQEQEKVIKRARIAKATLRRPSLGWAGHKVGEMQMGGLAHGGLKSSKLLFFGGDCWAPLGPKLCQNVAHKTFRMPKCRQNPANGGPIRGKAHCR